MPMTTDVGRFQVTIASNGLEAQLRLRPGPAETIDDAREALANADVVHGIDDHALIVFAAFAGDSEASGTEIVARGTEPVNGENGYLRGGRLESPLAGTTAEDGHIDYRERHTLHPAADGEVLAEIVAPTAGTPGRDVRGHKIASKPGQPHTQRSGPGVRTEGNELIATRDGVMFATDREIDCVPLYAHPSDVDYDSGNLHSRGSLLIKGDVRNGFSATADGDIVITGAVEGGGVTAGGTVSIGRGVLGHDHAVRAGTDILCHHATSARLIADHSIEIGDQAAQTSLQAPTIRVVKGHGAVRGGELRARDKIEVGSAGSPAGTPTTLAVGDLLGEQVELARRSAATSRLSHAVGRQDQNSKKGLRAAVRAGDDERTEQIRLKRRLEEVLRSATITITHTCHPGVLLKFGPAELYITDKTGPAIYHFDCEERSIVCEELQ